MQAVFAYDAEEVQERMCGIFGCVFSHEAVSLKVREQVVAQLFKLSETRGKEASGLAVRTESGLFIHREARPATELLTTLEYADFLRKFTSSTSSGFLPAFIGHARLTTNGLQGIATNNQPIESEGTVVVHNGIIVNVDDLWASHPEMERRFRIDTEVLTALIGRSVANGATTPDAARSAFRDLFGTASIAVLFDRRDELLLATNTGSLYYATGNEAAPVFVFASEKHILDQLLRDRSVGSQMGPLPVRQLEPGSGLIVSLKDLEIQPFRLDVARSLQPTKAGSSKTVAIHDTVVDADVARRNMRRCTRCVLPESFPYIEFDEEGICNYCRTSKPVEYLGPAALEEAIAPYRHTDGSADCIVMFSGGRDSSYCLHYVVKELGLRPIAYTYDWGMVNDLARRNQARLTGALGVEQVIVSADIKRKRNNIGKNVEAWIRKPELGTVSLFMAGDKQMFYYANQLMQKTGLELVFLASNQLERTNFKVGFCGVTAGNTRDRISSMSIMGKVRLNAYFLGQFLRNPRYVNRSLFDTAFAYLSYYFLRADYLWFFNYIPWNEAQVEETLISEYDWETDPDTPTTWRIGDETAAFYNHIYYTIAGFTENDTFRSNQVRQGLITREQALQMVEEENRPRYESIREYLALIGVDFDATMAAIDVVRKLY